MKELTVTKLPKLDLDHLEAVMAERIAATATPHTPVPMLGQGLLELDIPMGQATRRATLYVPKDTPQGTPFVLLNVLEGKETLPSSSPSSTSPLSAPGFRNRNRSWRRLRFPPTALPEVSWPSGRSISSMAP